MTPCPSPSLPRRHSPPQVELLENRLAPVVALSISNAMITEGAAGPRDMVFTVSLSMPSAEPVRVDFATVNASAAGLRLNRVASGLSDPLFVTAPPGDNGRLFIVQQGSGTSASIRILNRSTGTLNATPFLTVNGISTGGESGLLGLAFHPSYASNGLFFVAFTDATGAIVLRRYQVQGGNPDLANPASATTVLTFAHPFENHNAGWVAFGTDGFLYLASGDGGGGYDPLEAGQRLDTLLGKLLRIDIDGDDFPADPNRNYAIPPTNPFAGDGDPNTLGEIWAYGLRNPWRNSFDRLTGDLYIGDVGQNQREEINVQPSGSPPGRNYGWRLREGTIETPEGVGGPRPPGSIDPIFNYDHLTGGSITGGYVYRGPIPELQGQYFFADFVAGRTWSLRWNGTLGVAPVPGGNNFTDFTEWTELLVPNAGTLRFISSFGEDPQGNLYLVDLAFGDVFQLAEGGDYLPLSGQLLFQPGELTQTITVRALGDRLDETNETFLVNLSNPSGATIDDGQGVGTLVDDDTAGMLQFSAAAYQAAENSGVAAITVTRTGGSDGSVTVHFAASNGSATSGMDFTAVTETIHFRHGQTSATVLVPLLDDSRFEGNETVNLTLTNPTFGAALGPPSTAVLTLGDNDRLTVTELMPTLTGFHIAFNGVVDAGVLNLYDTQAGILGPVDVTVSGNMSGAITGSLVVDPGGDGITFIRTGGLLAPDSYTVTLRSAANGFRGQTNGELLDGDGDGVAGGNYVSTFSIAASSVVIVSIPDVTRGPGQMLDVPTTSLGLPLRLSAGAGITSVSLTLRYDARLLDITEAVVPMGLPMGAMVTLNDSTPGTAIINFTSPTPLSGAGLTEFVRLTAMVPRAAASLYTAKHVLDLTNITINPGAISARDDDGIHVNAYLGDITANGSYSSTDAQRALRIAVGLDAGSDTFALADPVVFADVAVSSSVTATDATRLLQEAVGIDQTDLPPIPPGIPTIMASGPDPLLSIPRRLSARPGGLVTVPVNLDRSEGLDSADVALSYDPRLLELVGVQRGRLTRDFDLFLVNVDAEAGTIRAGLGRSAGLVTGRGSGSVLRLVFRIRSDAAAENTLINLRQRVGTTATLLNEGGLDLNPDPRDEAGDHLDGEITIVPRRRMAARMGGEAMGLRAGREPRERMTAVDTIFFLVKRRPSAG